MLQGMDLKNIILSEINKEERKIIVWFHLIWNIYNRQIHKTESRLEFIGGWGVKEMRSYFLMVKEFLFGMMKKLWK